MSPTAAVATSCAPRTHAVIASFVSYTRIHPGIQSATRGVKKTVDTRVYKLFKREPAPRRETVWTHGNRRNAEKL